MLEKFITEDYLKKDGSLDHKLITDSLSENQPLLKNLQDFNSSDLKSFFHILLTNNCYKALGQIIEWVENDGVKGLGLYKVLSALLTKKISISTEIMFKEISLLEPEEAVNLLPYEKQLDDKSRSLVEQAKYKITSKINDHKTDLLEQIKFLNQQELTEKAEEMQQKLEFHFPKLDNADAQSSKVKLQQSKDLNFSKIIKRNLSFNLRTKSRIDKKVLEKINKRSEEDQKLLNSMVSTWHDIFKHEIEDFIAQLEFLSIQRNEIYEDILKNNKDLDLWTKVELLLKTGRAFEGLNLLLSKEKEILDKNTDATYNYYYYKALLYEQIGMSDEAEEIFKALYEQKQNFRDVNFYLKN